MEFELGRGKRARRAYGFDEVALVPGRVTVNPAEIDVSFSVNGTTLEIPFLAAAMDGVVDTRFAAEMGHLGGLAVLNLDGVQTRYEDPADVLSGDRRVPGRPDQHAPAEDLHRAGAGRAHRSANRGDHPRRRRMRRVHDPRPRRAPRSDRSGSRRAHARRAGDRAHGAPRQQVVQTPLVLRADPLRRHPGGRRQLRRLRDRPGADGHRHQGIARRCRTGRGMHNPRGARSRRSPGHRHQRLRSRS